jgi:hypothetical protein
MPVYDQREIWGNDNNWFYEQLGQPNRMRREARARPRTLEERGKDLSDESAVAWSERLRPGYSGVADANGRVLSQYQVDQGLAAQASPWAAMQRAQALQTRMMEADNLANSGAASAAQARTALAMRGGMTSGSAERLGQAQMREQMMGSQNLARQNMQQNLDIGSQDYQRNIENQRFNIQNSISDLNARNQYAMDTYRTRMSAIGAEKNADATRKSGKIICGELGRQGYLDAETLKADAEFGEIVLLSDPEIMIGYWKLATPIVRLMKKSKAFTRLVALIALPWSRHMAYRMGIAEKDSAIGRMVMTLGAPVCKFVGKRSVACRT